MKRRSSTLCHTLLCTLALALGLAGSPSRARAGMPDPSPSAGSAIEHPVDKSATKDKGGWEDADMRPMMQQGESFQSTTMVTAAYAFIWLAVLAFVASVWMRSRQVEREIEELSARIARSGPSATSDPGALGKA